MSNELGEKTEKYWRGAEDGFPPIGTKVQWLEVTNDRWRNGDVIAHYNGHVVVCDRTCMHITSYAKDDLDDLRPSLEVQKILSGIEREEVSEKMHTIFVDAAYKNDIHEADVWMGIYALYDAGFRMKEDED